MSLSFCGFTLSSGLHSSDVLMASLGFYGSSFFFVVRCCPHIPIKNGCFGWARVFGKGSFMAHPDQFSLGSLVASGMFWSFLAAAAAAAAAVVQ